MARSNLIRFPAVERNRRAGWLADHNSTPLQRAIVERAFDDVGILEVPLGSNDGTRIRTWQRRYYGVPKAVWWCGLWVGCVWADAGALVPADFPAVDAWLPHLQPDPVPGAAVIFGPHRKDGTHIEIVVRVDTMLLTIGGNRSAVGGGNNGVGVFGPLPIVRKDVLGYVHPTPAPPPMQRA